MGEKKSTYKSGLTLLHSHRETQVAEERIKVNGVPACADTKVAGNLNTSCEIPIFGALFFQKAAILGPIEIIL